MSGFHSGTREGYYFHSMAQPQPVVAALPHMPPGVRPKTSECVRKYEIENYTLAMHFDGGSTLITFLLIVFTKMVISTMTQKTQAFG